MSYFAALPPPGSTLVEEGGASPQRNMILHEFTNTWHTCEEEGRPGWPGARGVTAIAELAARLTQGQLKAVRAFHSPTCNQFEPPSKTCLYRILSSLDPDALDEAVSRFVESRRALGGSLASLSNAAISTGQNTRTFPASARSASILRGPALGSAERSALCGYLATAP